MSQNKEMVASNRRHYLKYAAAKPKNATPSRTYCTASVLTPLVLPKWEVRAGADDHLAIGSRGLV